VKKILITGASGFIGNFLIEEGIKRKYEVYAAIRSSSNIEHLKNKAINFIEIDFANKEDLNSKIASAPKFNYIIHNAGITKSLRKKNFFEINYHYTKNFIEAISFSNHCPLKFLYISSLSASGPGEDDLSVPISISDISAPITNYGLSKLSSEKYIAGQQDMPYIIVRPTAVYGPGDKDFFNMVKFINHHMDLMIGSHKQALSFIYVKDLTRSIYDLLESHVSNKKYFITDGNIYNKTAMSDLIADIMKKKINRVYIPVVIAKTIAVITETLSRIKGKASVLNLEKIKEFSASNWNCDISSLIKDINFKPDYSLRQGLKETIEWYELQGWIKKNKD
jgi:nucleoside-diphosphate-sugar epimerase